MAVSAVILAGGRGERLGRDKATLELGGQTLLQRQIALLSHLSDDLIVVQRSDQNLSVERARLVTDLRPFTGVLAGFAAGLVGAMHPWAIVVACDMPFLNLNLLRYLLSLRTGYDLVVPRLDVGLEPLHALYHRRCLSSIRRALEEGQRRVVSFYDALRVRYVQSTEIAPLDPQGCSFFNINTPDDLVHAEQWLHTKAV